MLEGAIDQCQAKLLLPPKSSLWRGNTGVGAWHVHVWGVGCKSKSWVAAGSYDNALRYVLQWSWKKFLLNEGLEESTCPIKGMMEMKFGLEVD